MEALNKVYEGPAGPPPEEAVRHEGSIALEGLEDLFEWASGVVSEGEDAKARRAREKRIRRQVLEAVERLKEKQAAVRAAEEIAYLQRRLIAVMQKLQEAMEQNSALKQLTITQAFALQKLSALEEELKRLQSMAFDGEEARAAEQELLKALSKLKVDRDFLDDLLRANEEENFRLANLLSDAKVEIARLTRPKWWQFWRNIPASPSK